MPCEQVTLLYERGIHLSVSPGLRLALHDIVSPTPQVKPPLRLRHYEDIFRQWRHKHIQNEVCLREKGNENILLVFKAVDLKDVFQNLVAWVRQNVDNGISEATQRRLDYSLR
jgi:hypothetical protein